MKETVTSPPANTRPPKENSGSRKQFFPNGHEDSFFNTIGVQPKLNIGQRGDKFERQADSMADKIISKQPTNATISPKAAPEETSEERLDKKEEDQQKDENTLQRKPMFESEDDPNVQRSMYPEVDEGERVFRSENDSSGPLSKGESIVAIARSKLGKVRAKEGLGSDGGKQLRYGYETLLEIFHLAAPGVWSDDVIKYLVPGLPSWCGIFAVYCIKKSGIDIGNWQMGKGVSSFGKLKQTDSPQAGDIAYMDAHQHHAIVVKVEGDVVHTIDGNSGLKSEITENQRPIKAFRGFFTALHNEATSGDNVQKKENAGTSHEASPSIEGRINSSKGGGSPLDTSTRGEMESSFGSDFGGVRIHTGSEAQQLSKDLNAQAFTHGQDIYFDEGKYNPQSTSGKHLLAHELTHTVQQTGGANKSLARSEASNTVQLAKNPPSGGKKSGKGLLADGSIVGSDVILTNFPLKKYEFHGKTINAPTALVTGVRILKVGERKTNQDAAWKKMVKDDVKESLIQRAAEQKLVNKIIIKRKGKEVLPMGTPSELGERDELINPKWDINGNDVFNEIEHQVDALIAGNAIADDPANLMLLDKKTNRSIGSGHVRSLIKNSVDNVLDENPNNSLKYKTFAALQKNGNVKIQSGVNTDIVHPTSVWEKNDFSKSKLKNNSNPLSSKYLEMISGNVPAGSFILKTKNNPLGYVVKFTEKNHFIELKPDHPKKPTQIEATIKQIFKQGTGKAAGVFESIPEKNVNLVQDAKDADVWVLNLPTYNDSLNVKYLSPLTIDENGVDFNPYSGIVTKGKVKSDIPLLRDVNISFEAGDSNFTISADIDTDYLNDKFPKPFSVDYSTFSISASTKDGLSIGGEIGFGIDKVGKGNLKASLGRDGLSLEGSFDFDPKLFKGKVNQAGIKAAYNKKDGWKIEGDLSITDKAVKGIKSGNIHIEYANHILKAEGAAETTIKGVSEVTLRMVFGKEIFEIEGSVKIQKLTGIKEGEGTLKIVKKDNDYDFSGKGKITPDIPGIDTQVDFEFANDIFTVDASLQYKRDRLEGKLKLGITNQELAQGVPTGKKSDTYTVYGGGQISLKITDSLKVTAGVNFLPNGEVEVTGRIDLPKKFSLFPAPLPKRKKELLRVPINIPTPIPVIQIYVYGYLNAEAEIGEGYLDDVFAEVKYNPSHPEQMSMTGGMSFNMPAYAEIKAGVEFGVKASLLIASIRGGIDLSAALRLSVPQPILKGELKWSPATGFELDGIAKIGIMPSLIFTGEFKITGEIDLLVGSLSKSWEWPFGSMTLAPNAPFGMEFPFKYNKNTPFNLSFDQIRFTYPSVGQLADSLKDSVVNKINDKLG
jgi:hypothetical protein